MPWLEKKVTKRLGLSYKTAVKYGTLKRRNINPEKRRKRCDAVSDVIKDQIKDFYERPDISTVMPNKKCASANGTSQHVLHRSLKETYKTFIDSSNATISTSKFCELRPKHILTPTKAKLYQCLCEYCANVDLKLKAINTVSASVGVKCGDLIDRYHASDKTICKQTGLDPMISCIDRKCGKCGTSLLMQYLDPLLQNCSSKMTTWQRWGQTCYGPENKKRVTILRHTGSIKMLVDELLQEMTTFSRHLFNAKWQQLQFYKCIRTPLQDEVITVMDFAENYQCLLQQEVQSAHWYQMQVTLHPIIAYYKCNSTTCTDTSTVREAIDVITSDKVHDTHAVAHFMSKAVQHLKEDRKLKLQKLVQFSDGCSAQYKSRTTFTDISFGTEDLNIPVVQRHYFGSRHGKNPCDGEGGVVKCSVSRAVKSKPDIIVNDSHSLYQYCKEHMTRDATKDGKCCHSRRWFIYVKDGDINRNRPDRTKVATLPGTRKLHAVQGVGPYKVQSRQLSCFCNACVHEESGARCANSDVVSKWTNRKLHVRVKGNVFSMTIGIILQFAFGFVFLTLFNLDDNCISRIL